MPIEINRSIFRNSHDNDLSGLIEKKTVMMVGEGTQRRSARCLSRAPVVENSCPNSSDSISSRGYPQIFAELLERLTIHAGCTAIGPDRFIRFVHTLLYDVKRLVCRDRRPHPVSSCSVNPTHLIRPLCSSPITGPSTLIQVGPSQTLASVLASRFWPLQRIPWHPRSGSCSSTPEPASASRPLYAGCCPSSNQVADRLVPED
jgi:hypothetical protein